LDLGCGYVQAPASGGTGGTISGNVTGTVTNPGQLDLAPSPAPPTLTGYTQTVTGILVELIGGLTEYGQMIVTGDVSLAGSLVIRFFNNYTPAAGDPFTVIDNRGSNPI